MTGEYMNKEFLLALEELEVTKGISAEILIETLEAALISAYKKNYGSAQNVRVEINRKTGEIHVYFRKEVVEEVQDERIEMSLAEAQSYDDEFEIGDMFESEVTPRSFGRIAAQTAKQVVVQRLREAERNMLFDKYADSEGTIMKGEIVKIEGKNVIIDLGKTEAVLPPNEQIPGERYAIGESIRVHVDEVRRVSRGAQLVVSRAQNGLLKGLLASEIPEIADGTVEIKSVVRDPGSRAKIAVFSNNPDVDAVGSCVGSRGLRVQNIVNELSGEKLEIIEWSSNLGEFICNAISPAKALEVEADNASRVARVVVADSQLSLAIGKRGQNARLAVRLTACKIDIKSESQMAVILEEEARAKALAELEAANDEVVVEDVEIAETVDVDDVVDIDEEVAAEETIEETVEETVEA